MSGKITLIVDWVDRIFTWPVLLYRLWKYKYTFRRIYLGEGKWTIVDPQDYYRLKNFKWIVYGTGSNFYVIRYKIIDQKKTTIVSMHREITNPPDNLLVDHRNVNALDNRRADLRLATNSQNQCNRPKTRLKTTSRYIGVHFDKRAGRWAAMIRKKGKKTWLGYYDCEIEAARAYDAAAREYHGEFARLNFPERSEGPRMPLAGTHTPLVLQQGTKSFKHRLNRLTQIICGALVKGFKILYSLF